jgi:hypothetical protein
MYLELKGLVLIIDTHSPEKRNYHMGTGRKIIR